jgi:hypothetical protein
MELTVPSPWEREHVVTLALSLWKRAFVSYLKAFGEAVGITVNEYETNKRMGLCAIN